MTSAATRSIVAHCRLSGRIGIARSAAMRSRLSAVDAEELATLQVFADIPVEDLATLAVNLKPLRAAAGEVLMRQGERAESFSIITSGRVEIRHVATDGQVVVTELSSGTMMSAKSLCCETH